MKTKLSTIIVLAGLYCTSILTSCNQNNPQPNTNTNTASTAWKFKFTINGVTHRIEGNGNNYNSNFCAEYSTLPVHFLTIGAAILDKTIPSYISGDIGGFRIEVTSPKLGINSISDCYVVSDWLSDISEDLYLYGYSLTLNGPQVPGSAVGVGMGLPINITSLGSTGVGLFKDPVKGNYSGTIYYRSTVGSNVYDTPISIDLEFEAMRP